MTGAAYRLWDPTAGQMAYLTQAFRSHYQIGWSSLHYVDMGGYEQADSSGYDAVVVTMPNTTLRASDGQPIYAGDIISFTIKGITHGPEREDVAAAHVWWCAEDGCWAFGRYRWSYSGSPEADWWYTMQDRIDRSTIKVLGNVYEHPELLPRLGYDPFASPTPVS